MPNLMRGAYQKYKTYDRQNMGENDGTKVVQNS